MPRRRRVYVSQGDRVQARTCPVCRVVLDGATGLSLDREPSERPVPRPGDLTICAHCATVLVTTAKGFRLATDADLAPLDPDLRRFFAEYQRQRPGRA